MPSSLQASNDPETLISPDWYQDFLTPQILSHVDHRKGTGS